METNFSFQPTVTCFPYDRYTHTRGIWYGENPLNDYVTLSMFQMILFSTISRISYFLLRPLKQPKIVCNVLAGFLLGPSVLGRYNRRLMDRLFPANEMLTMGTLSGFAMICFVFLKTVKTDKKMIKRTAKDGWILGAFSILLPFGTSFILINSLKGYLPGLRGSMAALILSGILSTSFLSDVACFMEELKLLTSELGQVAVSSAMIGDVIAWTMMGIFTILDNSKASHSGHSLLLLALFLIIAIYAIKPTLLWIIKKTPEGKPVHQDHVVAILIQALIIGTITDVLGLGYLPGIMLMGLIVPNGPPLGAALTEKAELIVNELFLPFFYLLLGRFLDINAMQDWKEFNILLLIVISVYVAKSLAVCLHALFYKMNVRKVVVLALILNLRGALKYIYFLRFYANQRMDEECFALLTLSHVVITGITTPLIEYLYKPHLRLMETSLSAKLSTMSLQTTPIIGELRILSCIHSEDDVQGVITLLEASNPTPETPRCAYIVHVVELVGRATPLLGSYEIGRKAGKSSTDRIMRAFTNYSKASNESVAVQSFISIAPYKTMHESICRLAGRYYVPLIIVPFHKSQIGEINANLRYFNLQMQDYALCTVGILVQRRNLCCVNSVQFSCKVAVLFIGGADDREALALATRMSGHPCVKITVIRFILKENEQENELEKELDDRMLNQFKAETEANVSSVECSDVLVKNSIEILRFMRGFENDNDLVIVGKRQESNAKLEGDMATWIEYPELGVIGDMVASEDFGGGRVSVLVLQHCSVGLNSKSIPTKSRYSFNSFSMLG